MSASGRNQYLRVKPDYIRLYCSGIVSDKQKVLEKSLSMFNLICSLILDYGRRVNFHLSRCVSVKTVKQNVNWWWHSGF